MARNKLNALVIAKMVDRMTAPARKIKKNIQALRKTMQLKGVDERWRQVGRRVERFKGNVRGLSRMTGYIAGITTALGYLFTRFASGNDRIAKFARQINWTTDQLQEMRYAAQILAGVGTQNFDTAMQRFTRRVAEAAAGTGEAQAALEYLGIELTDGQGRIRNTSELLLEVADAMQKVQNEQTRNLISTKLFDTEGAALVNMLSAGRAEIEKYRKEAGDIGGVISEEDLKRSEAYGDNIARLRTILTGLVARIQGLALPAVVELSNRLVALMSTPGFNQRLLDGVNSMVASIKQIAEGVQTVVGWVGGWKNAMIGLFAILASGAILNLIGIITTLSGVLKTLALMVLPLVTAALKWLAIAAAVNPIILLVGALAGAAVLIISNWSSVKEFFVGLWADIKDIFQSALGWISSISDRISSLIPDFIKNGFNGSVAVENSRVPPVQETITQRRARNGGSAAGTARAEVGGELHIRIDSEGRPRVQQLQQQGGMGLRVDTGMAFAGT